VDLVGVSTILTTLQDGLRQRFSLYDSIKRHVCTVGEGKFDRNQLSLCSLEQQLGRNNHGRSGRERKNR
jgi:hypothetical protein